MSFPLKPDDATRQEKPDEDFGKDVFTNTKCELIREAKVKVDKFEDLDWLLDKRMFD